MWAHLFTSILLSQLILASPVPAPEPAPLSAEAFADWPVNIILIAGAAQFGVWVNHDGVWRSTASMSCLNAGAGSYGACSTPSFNQIGVVSGNGPCSIIGANGFRKTLPGNPGDGFVQIAPPQQLTWISCGP